MIHLDEEIVFMIDPALHGQGYDCSGCSSCCKALTVKLSVNDINRLKTGLREDDTREFYSTLDRTLNKNENGCLFLEKDRCTVYEHRPDTCRIFPYKFRISGNTVTISIHELAEYTCFKEHPDWEKQLDAVKTDILNMLENGSITDIFDTDDF